MSAGAPPQLSEEDLLVPAARPKLGKRLRSMSRKYASAIALIVAILVAWEVIVRAAHVPEYLLPSPTEILADLKTDWVILWPAMWVTLREVLIGFVIATVAGVGLAVLLHLYGPLRRALYPILIGSQTPHGGVLTMQLTTGKMKYTVRGEPGLDSASGQPAFSYETNIDARALSLVRSELMPLLYSKGPLTVKIDKNERKVPLTGITEPLKKFSAVCFGR